MELIELEELIKKTTAEVVNRALKSQAVSFKDLSMPKLKQLLLIIPANVINLEESVKQIENKYCDSEFSIASYKKTDAIKFSNAKEIYDLNGESSRDKLANNINKYEEIIVLSPELTQMRALTQGDDSGFIENLLIYSLLHKKKTVFLFDYDMKAVPYNSLGKKIKDLLGSISEMGVLIEDLLQDTEKKSDAVTVSSKQLITEEQVEDFYKNGRREILCEKGCIITPLARDAAREMGVNFIQLEV
ncbi:hypothetical protein [Candidatus Clostridium stratigraminis]|uniref:Ethanolamine utilization protein n=1 Tax=Candidatus Clostridium stratigraminis TaxID=3381661 RepID=A0ABW8T937_9CLOT